MEIPSLLRNISMLMIEVSCDHAFTEDTLKNFIKKLKVDCLRNHLRLQRCPRGFENFQGDDLAFHANFFAHSFEPASMKRSAELKLLTAIAAVAIVVINQPMMSTN